MALLLCFPRFLSLIYHQKTSLNLNWKFSVFGNGSSGSNLSSSCQLLLLLVSLCIWFYFVKVWASTYHATLPAFRSKFQTISRLCIFLLQIDFHHRSICIVWCTYCIKANLLRQFQKHAELFSVNHHQLYVLSFISGVIPTTLTLTSLNLGSSIWLQLDFSLLVITITLMFNTVADI